MLFNIPLSQKALASENDVSFQFIREERPLFENMPFRDELHAVKILCDYIDNSGTFYERLDISPEEYSRAAYGDVSVDFSAVSNVRDEKRMAWISAIELAHSNFAAQEAGISSEVLKKALLIAAYVEDYDRLEVLLQSLLQKKVPFRKNKPLFFRSYLLFATPENPFTEEEEQIAIEAIQYAKYGYLEGLKRVLKRCENRDFLEGLLETLLLKSAQKGRIKICLFLFEGYPDVFSKEVIEESFATAGNLEVAQYLWNKRREDITLDVLNYAMQKIVELKRYHETFPQLKIASFIIEQYKLIGETEQYSSINELDSLFIFLIRRRANELVAIFIKENLEYAAENAESIVPMLARIGVKEEINLLLEKRSDLGADTIIDALFESVKRKTDKKEGDFEVFDFLLEKRPDAVREMPIEKIKEMLLLLLEKEYQKMLNRFLVPEILEKIPQAITDQAFSNALLPFEKIPQAIMDQVVLCVQQVAHFLSLKQQIQNEQQSGFIQSNFAQSSKQSPRPAPYKCR